MMKKAARTRRGRRSVNLVNRLLDPYMGQALTIPQVQLERFRNGYRISVTGEASGGEVEWVVGAVLPANQKIPAQPPASARRRPATLITVGANRCIYTFVQSGAVAARDDQRLGPARLGINNRVVTWARIAGKTIISDVCLQFEGVEDDRNQAPVGVGPDYHKIDYPIAIQQVPNPTPPPNTMDKLGTGVVVNQQLASMSWSVPQLSKPVSRIAARVFSSVNDQYFNTDPDGAPAGFFQQVFFVAPQRTGNVNSIPKATVNSDQNILVSWSKHRIPGNPETPWIRCFEDRVFLGVP